MADSLVVTCPECGTYNSHSARLCRQCGALLHAEQGAPPARIQKKLLRRTDFLAAARANRANTNRLVVILIGIAAILGYLIGWNLEISSQHWRGIPASAWFLSQWGVYTALLLAGGSGIWTMIAFKAGDRIVMHMTGADLCPTDEEPVLHNVVEEMAIAAGLPKPKVYLMETAALNAFATGMSPATASIAVTRGLLNALTRDELQGVIGHEMGHIVNWDIRYATAVSVLVGLIVLVSDGVLRSFVYGGGRRRSSSDRGSPIVVVLMLVFALLAPLFAKLVQMAISRQREFLADATSVRLTRNARGLVSALEKLAASTEPMPGANRATQHLFIVNPLRNFGEDASALLATHPPIERRIARLLNLGAKGY